eukprot:6173306-Pleurochrysis_carterae.AAC.4
MPARNVYRNQATTADTEVAGSGSTRCSPPGALQRGAGVCALDRDSLLACPAWLKMMRPLALRYSIPRRNKLDKGQYVHSWHSSLHLPQICRELRISFALLRPVQSWRLRFVRARGTILRTAPKPTQRLHLGEAPGAPSQANAPPPPPSKTAREARWAGSRSPVGLPSSFVGQIKLDRGPRSLLPSLTASACVKILHSW